MADSNFDLKGFLNDPKVQSDKEGAIKYLQQRGIIDQNGQPIKGMYKEATPAKSIGGFMGNVVSSGAGVVGGLATALMHPIKTVTGAFNIASGALQESASGYKSMITGKPPVQLNNQSTQTFDSMEKLMTDRYGSLDKVKETAYNDPVGFALDLSTVLSGAGGLVSKVGDVSKVSELSRAGEVISKAGEITNPITQATKLVGKGAEIATAGKTIGGGKYVGDVIPSAKRMGISKADLPISTLTKSPVSASLEGIAAKGFGGGSIMSKIENVYQKMNEKIDKVLTGTPSATDLGKNIAQAVDDFKSDFFKQKSELYKEAVIPRSKAIGESTEAGVIQISPEMRKPMLANTTETQKLLNRLISTEKQALKGYGVSSSPELKTYEGLLNGLSNSKLTTSDVNRTLQKLEGDIRYGTLIKTGNNAKLSLIQQTLDSEFMATLKQQRPDLAEALTKADEFYKQGIYKINSSIAQTIIKNSDKPDVIVSSLLPKIGSVEDIKTLSQLVGEKNMVGIRQQVLSDIFDKAKGVGRENLQPLGISRQIKNFGDDRLQALLKPEQYQTVRDLEKVSMAMEKGQKILGGSQTAYLQKLGVGGAVFTALGMLGSGNIAGFATAISAIIGDIAFNKFISSDIGKELLTQGLTLSGKTGRKLQKIGSPVGTGAMIGQQLRNIQNSQPEQSADQLPTNQGI